MTLPKCFDHISTATPTKKPTKKPTATPTAVPTKTPTKWPTVKKAGLGEPCGPSGDFVISFGSEDKEGYVESSLATEEYGECGRAWWVPEEEEEEEVESTFTQCATGLLCTYSNDGITCALPKAGIGERCSPPDDLVVSFALEVSI